MVSLNGHEGRFLGQGWRFPLDVDGRGGLSLTRGKKDIEEAMVFGESASQATLFAASGATQGAIIPHALVLNPAISEKGKFRLIEQSLHTPLLQRMVLLKDAGETAQKFYAYLQSAPAREILREYGFTVSGKM